MKFISIKIKYILKLSKIKIIFNNFVAWISKINQKITLDNKNLISLNQI